MLNWHFTLHSPSKIKIDSSRNKSEVSFQILPTHICSSMKSSSPEWHYLEAMTGLSQLHIPYYSLGFTILEKEILSLTELVQQMFIVANTERRTRVNYSVTRFLTPPLKYFYIFSMLHAFECTVQPNTNKMHCSNLHFTFAHLKYFIPLYFF